MLFTRFSSISSHSDSNINKVLNLYEKMETGENETVFFNSVLNLMLEA